MLDCHGTQVCSNAQILVQKLQASGGGELWGGKGGHPETPTHAKVDVHHSRLWALSKEVEQILAMHLYSVQNLSVYCFGACKGDLGLQSIQHLHHLGHPLCQWPAPSLIRFHGVQSNALAIIQSELHCGHLVNLRTAVYADSVVQGQTHRLSVFDLNLLPVLRVLSVTGWLRPFLHSLRPLESTVL